MSQPIYKRILLKLSGEALQGDEGFGIDPSILDRMALEIKELIEMGVEVGVVLGGGNLFRGAKLAKAGMNRVVGDHMGMLATVMNGLAMRDALHRADVNAKLMSAFQLNGICDTYNWSEAIKMLREKRVVIFSAGTGSPFFTTDSAACLRGIEIEADIVLKATKVDGVYDCDPAKNPNAKLYQFFNLTPYDQGSKDRYRSPRLLVMLHHLISIKYVCKLVGSFVFSFVGYKIWLILAKERKS